MSPGNAEGAARRSSPLISESVSTDIKVAQPTEVAPDAVLDVDAVRTWLKVLYVNAPGLVHISSSNNNWAGRAFDDQDQAVEYVAQLDAVKPDGIYLRATTLRDRPQSGRGTEADSLALPGLWADVDIAGPGHKTAELLPPDVATARHLVDESGLPEPTLWVHSGGGLYPWWLLDAPVEISGENIAEVRTLSSRWQTVLGRSASALGWHYGTGVGDLPRILRIPGTVNRKAGLARPCRIIDAQLRRYSLDELRAGLAAGIERHPGPKAPAVPTPRPASAAPTAGQVTPNDDFEARTPWDDGLLLGGAGWRIHKGRPGSYCEWIRPGKDTAGISATTGKDSARDRMWVFSEDAGLPVREEMTKPYVFALLHHRGDTKAATKDLAQRGFGTPTERPVVTRPTSTNAEPRTAGGTVGVVPSWDPEPLPLGWAAAPAPFPADVFPPVVEKFVQATAHATQTPVDLPGVAVLGIIAAAIGGRVDVQCPTWTEPTNLFVVPVLPPASRKSAVIAACRVPLTLAEKRLQLELSGRAQTSFTRWQILDKRAEALKTLAGKADGTSAQIADAEGAVQEAEEARREIVAAPRLTTSDSTPEALVSLLAEQGGRIAAISAEAGLFATLTGRYTKAANLDPVLMAHAGDSITVDRRSRATEHVEAPALTLLASIQPYALKEMLERDDFAGRGLLARVLWSLPVDNTGHRQIRGVTPVSPEDVKAYHDRIVDLTVHAGLLDERVVLTMSLQAAEVFLTYAERVEAMLRPKEHLGEYQLTREWGGKLAGAVARIAGCLHAAAGPQALKQPISEATMKAAVKLGEYFRAHAMAALTPGEDKRTAASRTVLDVLVDRMGAPETFTVRELHRRVPRFLQSSEELHGLLSYLTQLGWVQPTDGRGWLLHPKAADTHKSADTADTSDGSRGDAGQRTATGGQAPSAPPLTAADSADTPASVSAVSKPADTVARSLTRDIAPDRAAVSTVSTFREPDAFEMPAENCPDCTWPVDSNGHTTNCGGRS